jgi:hypothetical protein
LLVLLELDEFRLPGAGLGDPTELIVEILSNSRTEVSSIVGKQTMEIGKLEWDENSRVRRQVAL